MNMQSMNSRRAFVLVFIVLIISCELAVYEGSVKRSGGERLFQMYLLGGNHMAADYYPQNDTDIRPGVIIRWYLGTTNYMGSVQIVEIRVKIANQTTKSPDDVQALESPAPALTDIAKVLQNNETWETPWVWSVQNGTISGGSTHILLLKINNETYPISDWMASNGYNFRIIFELWTWQSDSNAFHFGWTSNGEQRVAWLQVWFNMTSVSPIGTAQ